MSILRRSILVIGILLVMPLFASAQGTSDEQIDNFHTDVTVAQDGSLSVIETIAYNFGPFERHGIYRTLPYQYTRNGAKYTLRYEIVSVTDEQGIAYPFSQSRSGGNVEVKIGNADFTISGQHIYVISYTVRRAINYFKDHDELYWNATGTDWQVPILEASARVHLPSSIDPSTITTACYTGTLGSTAKQCSAGAEGDTVVFRGDGEFKTYEGLSIVVGFPTGIIEKPSPFQGTLFFLHDNWILVAPILAFIVLHILWMKKGRDPRGRGTIIPEYEPPNKIDPATMGALWDEKADPKDVSAEIVHLAVRGYLKIKNTGEKEYEFIKVKNADAQLNTVERAIHDSLFSDSTDTVTLDSLKNKYYKKLPDVQKSMYEALVERKYYSSNPNAIRKVYYSIGGLLIFSLFFIFGGLPGPFWVAFLVTGILVLIYGRIMPQKTLQGAEAKEQVHGFKWFLSVTEEERLKFHNAPEKKPEQFEKFLPYAMVLGVEKEWAKQFAGMYIPEPSWYQGGNVTAFNAIIFASVLSDMNSKMNSTLASRPSSAGSGHSGFGGGGFSGGGFGGGGGGSW